MYDIKKKKINMWSDVKKVENRRAEGAMRIESVYENSERHKKNKANSTCHVDLKYRNKFELFNKKKKIIVI